MPDNVLFQDNDGQKVRADLMDKCNLHTILRLPTGIFYAQGVKTNVLFFERGKTDKGNTPGVWFYDLRSDMPSFGKRTPFTTSYFEDFIKAYTAANRSAIVDKRWNYLSREDIKQKNDSLDLGLIADESLSNAENLGEPAEIAEEVLAELEEITLSLKAILKELN